MGHIINRAILTIILKEEEVNEILNYHQAYNSLKEAFVALDNKIAVNYKRVRTSFGGATLSYQSGGINGYLGFKSFIRGNFISLLFSTSGELLLIAESDRMSQIRTASLSVLASDYLKGEYSTVGIIGLGKQGLAQVEAFYNLKSVDINVYSRTTARVNQSTEILKSEGINVKVMPSYKELCLNSDVIVTVTSSRDPFLKLDYLKKGSHINLMGSNLAERVEAFPEVIKAASIIAVEDIDQANEEAGDLILADKMKMLDRSKLVLFSNIITRKIQRYNKDDITIFKSVGIGLEDVSILKFIFEEAKKRGLGKEMELRGIWSQGLVKR
jgi:ornithine cyclodeaminase/alanine dehydrogenase-like protein (mu-crystallin family)